MPDKKTPQLADFPAEHQAALKAEMLRAMLEDTRPPLSIDAIKQMTPAEVTARKPEIDSFLSSYNPSAPPAPDDSPPA